jgi:hypothetical protein
LVRFGHPLFAYLKIGAFLLLQTSLAALVICSAWALLTRAPSAYGQESPPGSEAGSDELRPPS